MSPGRRPLVPLMLLLALGITAAAAEPTAAPADGGGSAGLDPRQWQTPAMPAAGGEVRFGPDEVVLRAEAGRPLHIERLLAGADGVDEAPLRIQAAIAVPEGAALAGGPALIALVWSPATVIAVGIGTDPDAGGDAALRRAWILSSLAGRTDQRPAPVPCYPGACPGHVRLVATTRDISAYASRDGWDWVRVGTWERTGELARPPERVLLGSGGFGGASPLDAAAHAAPLLESRFAQLAIDHAPATVPASLLKDYDKKPSLEDSQDALQAAGLLRQWSILGPLAPGAGPSAADGSIDPAAQFDLLGVKGGWKPFVPGDNPEDRIIILSDLLPRPQGGIVRFAAATITVDHPCLKRFLFDGVAALTLSLNGRPIAQTGRDGGEVRPDRFSVTAPLRQGENHLLVRLVSDGSRRAVFTLRCEDGDPLYHIALQRRLASDFNGETEAIIAGAFEISRRWEHLGFAHEAAHALDGVIANPGASPEQIDTALVERTRLHRVLRDEGTVTADIEALRQRWQQQDPGADPAAALIKTAQLWQRLDEPAKAEAALGQALAAAGTDPERCIDTGIACARVHQLLGARAAVATDLQAIARMLPDADPRHGEFLVAALARTAGSAQQLDAAITGVDIRGLSATALRQLAGLALRSQDGRLAREALAALAASPERDHLDATEVGIAESLHAAGGGDAAAVEHYRAALAAMAAADGATAPATPATPATPAGPSGGQVQSLGEVRSAYLRACLADSAAGTALLAEAAKVAAERMGHRPLPAEPRNFVVSGWFDDAGFRCYDPGFLAQNVHPEHVDISKPILGKPWVTPDIHAWDRGYLDLLSIFHAENCAAFAYAEIASDAEVDTQLSMGADDGLVVWFNGVKVHEDRIQRGIAPDSILVPVHFRRGANSILAMIQQGGGDWAFQLRIIDGSALADLAAVLAPGEEEDSSRSEAVQRLCGAFDSKERTQRYPEAVAIARLVLRAFPDRPEEQYAVAVRLVDLASARGDATLLRHLAAWLSGSPVAAASAHEARTRDAMAAIGATLCGAGECAGAAAAYGQLLRSGFDWPTQVQALYGLGELYRRSGYKRLAARCYQTALGLQIEDPEWFGRLHQGVVATRANQVDLAPTEPPTEVAAQLASAEHASDAGDTAAAVAGYQQLIETYGGGQLWQDGEFHFIPVAALAEQRLRGLGPTGLQAYRQSFDARAQELLRRCTPGEPEAFEQVARRYPLSTAAGQALDRAADCYRDLGAAALSSATVSQLLGGAGDPPAPLPLLLAKAAQAAAAGGDRARLAGISAELAHQADHLVIGGRPVATTAWLAQLAAGMPAAPAPAADVGCAGAEVLCRFPVSPMDARDAGHFTAGRELHAICRPAVAAGIAYLQTSEDAFAVDTASGAVLWQARNELPDLVSQRLPSDFRGLPEYTPALAEGLVVVRAVRQGRAVLDARDARTGALTWSSETLPQLRGMAAASSPAAAEGRIYALFVDQTRAYAAALSCREGRLLWLTPVSTRRVTVPVQGDFGIFIDGHAAVPACVGRDLYLANDLGGVVCIDAGSGQVRWMASYLRAVVGTADTGALVRLLNRVPTRVWVDAEHLYLAPHDSLSVYAFARDHGEAVWRRDCTQVRQIVGFAAPGQLLLQGEGLELVDAATGMPHWSWRPDDGDGPALGTAAIGATSVLVATSRGLYRLALAGGAVLEFHPWSSLGIGAPLPVNLQITGEGLIGVGNGVLVRFLAAAAPASTPTVIAGADAWPIMPAHAAPLPAAPPGSPLGLAWSLCGEAVRSIDHPAAWPAGDCLVRGERSLARIDVAGQRVVWRTAIVPDLIQYEISRDAILLVYQRRLLNRLTLIDLDSGRQRWSRDVGNFFVDAMDENPEGRDSTWFLCDEAVVKWDNHGNLTVFSPATGAEVFGFNTGGTRLGVSTHAGHLFVAVRRSDRSCIDDYDLSRQAKVASVADGSADGDDIAMPVGDGLILGHRDHSDRFDPATGKVTTFPFSFVQGWVQDEAGKSVAYGLTRENRNLWNNHWTSAVIDPASGKVLFQEIIAKSPDSTAPPVYIEHLAGERMVGILANRDGRNGVCCRRLADGTEAWFVPGGDPARLGYAGLAVLGPDAVVFRTRDDGVFDHQLIDLASGRIVAGGPLPGWPDPGMPVAVIGDHILYGTAQGLFALAPITPEAVPASDPDHGLATAATITVPWSHAPPSGAHGGPAAISVPAAILTAADRRLPDGDPGGDAGQAAAPALAAELRCAYDAQALALRVHVADGGLPHRDPCPGASLLTGDCLLLGIDPLDAGVPGRATAVTMAVAWVDGRPQLELIGGSFARGADGQALAQPSVRAAPDATGMGYEVVIPWAALRVQADERPGDGLALRLGLAVIAHGGDGRPLVEELGHGLIRGIDPRLWSRCVLAPAPR